MLRYAARVVLVLALTAFACPFVLFAQASSIRKDTRSKRAETQVPVKDHAGPEGTTTSTAKKILAPETKHAVELLNNAVSMADGLDPGSQAYVLDQAGAAINPIDPKRAAELYRSAFNAALAMPLTKGVGPQIGLESEIASHVASDDPSAAADLLIRADTPPQQAPQQLDSRGGFAMLIVLRLIARHASGDIEKAEELDRHLGRTGQYPYIAALMLIDYFHEHGNAPAAERIFSEAEDFCEQDDTYPGSVELFAELIGGSASEIGSTLVPDAIRAAVARAKKNDAQAATDGSDALHPTDIFNTAHGQVSASNQSTAIALELLPIAMKYDSSLADELRQENPQLAQITANYTAADFAALGSGPARRAYVRGEVTNSSAAAQFSASVKQRQVLESIVRASMQDPDQAAKSAREITDIISRCEALTMVARILIKRDPAKAASLLSQADALVDDVDTPVGKSFELEQIAGVWSKLQNREKSTADLHRAISISLGEIDKEKAADSQHRYAPYGTPSTIRCMAAVEQLAVISPEDAEKQVSAITDAGLKAFCLVRIAKAMLQKKSNVKLGSVPLSAKSSD